MYYSCCMSFYNGGKLTRGIYKKNSFNNRKLQNNYILLQTIMNVDEEKLL